MPNHTLKGHAPQRCRVPIINVLFAKVRPCQVTWALTLGRATFPTSVSVVNVGACYLCEARVQLHAELSCPRHLAQVCRHLGVLKNVAVTASPT